MFYTQKYLTPARATQQRAEDSRATEMASWIHHYQDFWTKDAAGTVGKKSWFISAVTLKRTHLPHSFYFLMLRSPLPAVNGLEHSDAAFWWWFFPPLLLPLGCGGQLLLEARFTGCSWGVRYLIPTWFVTRSLQSPENADIPGKKQGIFFFFTF